MRPGPTMSALVVILAPCGSLICGTHELRLQHLDALITQTSHSALISSPIRHLIILNHCHKNIHFVVMKIYNMSISNVLLCVFAF